MAVLRQEGEGVRVISVAVRHDLGLCLRHCGDGRRVRREVGLAETSRAGKTADIKAGNGADPPEHEVGKAGVERSIGVAVDPALFQRQIRLWSRKSGEREACVGLRIEFRPGFGQQQRATGFRLEVAGVFRQSRQEHEHGAVRGGGGRDERRERLTLGDGGEGGCTGTTQQKPRGIDGLHSFFRRHSLFPGFRHNGCAYRRHATTGQGSRMKQTIALVDDDRNILTSVSMTLEAEGFLVRTYTDGESALQGLIARPVDLAVLDVKMPRMDGMELLQRLRARSQLPVIFLTSKDEEVDELMGLRLGADDYITKPFSQRLLIERIRALLRRNEVSRAEGSGAAPGGVLVRGDLTLDETKHQSMWRGQDIQLTVTEFLLVKALAARPGMVKSRDQLIDAAYGDNIYVDDRTIDSHIKRVRKKFRASDDSFDHIETLYGIGYRYKEV